MGKRNLTKRDVGKVLMVYLPNNLNARFRWITKYNDRTGRFYARSPKIGVKIRNLKDKISSDYNKETLLPADTKVFY